MDRAEVAVRRPQHADEKLRVGTVLLRSGTLATVQWEDDGTVEENVRLGVHTLLAVVGTLRYQSLVDRLAFAERFKRDPMTVILELLREASKPLRATHIKEQLLEFGLEKDAVDKAWKSTYSKLAKHDGVRADSGLYGWAGPVTNRPDVSANGAATTKAHDSRGLELVEPLSGVPTPVVQDGPKHVLDIPAPAEKQSTDHAEKASQLKRIPSVDVDCDASAERGLREVLAEVLGSKLPQPVHRYLVTPLRVGAKLAAQDDAEIEHLFAAAKEHERTLLKVMFLAVPKPVEAVDAPEHLASLDAAMVGPLVAAAVEEVSRRPAPGSAMRAAIVWLVRRVSSSRTLLNDSFASYIELVAHLSVSPQKGEFEVLDTAARVLARMLPDLPGDTIDVDILARIARPLPFHGKGGRVDLIAAVEQVRPDAVSDVRWWDGVTVQALSECGRGPLGRVIALPDVIEHVVRPLLARELSLVTTRARLAFFYGLPVVLAEHLAPAEMAEAFRRVADQDRVATSWMSRLSGRQQLDALRGELRRARGEAETAVELAEAAERKAVELAERCARLERDLQGAHSHAISVRGAQERQIKIDVVRSLADLAAEVEELLVGRADPGLIVDRVRGLIASQGVKAIGAVGDAASFDPAVHDPLVGDPEAGTPVVVIRPGYRWSAATEEVLLQKALVEPA
ncbi:hypothetical protein AB0B54_28665 [Microbispora bryophytorum]|uniref:hypothetical protein n=1 Tax=Microbispora bryophytorum TaxID=1460882 RepID=UPI003408C292